jgi:hypothetical protein
MVMAPTALVVVDQVEVAEVMATQPLAQEHQDKVLMEVQAGHQVVVVVVVLDQLV